MTIRWRGPNGEQPRLVPIITCSFCKDWQLETPPGTSHPTIHDALEDHYRECPALELLAGGDR